MAFQFPPGPSVNQTFTPVAGVTYRWSGTAWHLIAGPASFITAADADTRYVNVDEAQNTTNRIINGKMAIDQRNAGAAVIAVIPSATTVFGSDRWAAQITGSGPGSVSLQRILHSPRIGEYACDVTVLTPDSTLAGIDFYLFEHKIEGVNVADLNFGQSGAKSFTFAFEMFSPVAGTFPVAFRNGAADRSYITTFTATAGALTTFSVTVPGDTTGTWNGQNGVGMLIDFGLGVGPTLTAPAANAWTAGNFIGAPGCTNFMATTGQKWVITNVRLYKGSVDFGPDRRLYAEELALCQRYYCKSYNQGTVPGAVVTNGIRGTVTLGTGVGVTNVSLQFPVAMRAAPTVTLYSFTTGAVGVWPINSVDTAVATAHISDNSGIVSNSAVTTASQFMGGHFTASAEL